MKEFHDMSDLSEDERIAAMGQTLRNKPAGITFGIFVDNEPGKAERYIVKVCKAYSFVEYLETVHGLQPGLTLIRFKRNRFVGAN